MSVRAIELLPPYIRRMCDEAVPPEDAELLKHFVTDKDREAFELLVARHGSMVLGTARRLVQNSHDAEDVFQAVFLSLARLAKTIRHGRTLPAWLHKSTCRIAARVRANRASAAEKLPPEPRDHVAPEAQLVWQEVCQTLDEELQLLPEQWRSPLLLCYLSGLTRDEAARQLGWSLGTLKRRLEEGRKALRIRLDRRGIGAVGLALTVLTPEVLQAAVSQSLFDSTLSMIFSTEAVVPATVSAYVLKSGFAMKGFAMKSILVLFAAIAVGVGVYAGMGQADPPKIADDKREDVKPAPAAENAMQWDDPLPSGSTLRFGTSRFRYGSRIKTLAVSPDGKLAFAANDNDLPRVFDLASGRVLFHLNWGGIEVGAFSPDGRMIVVQQGYDVVVFEAASGKHLRTIKGPLTNSWSHGLLVFTPDGKAIATITDSKDIHLIDFESGKLIRAYMHENPEPTNTFPQVLAVAFSPDGKLMATGGYSKVKDDYFARLWDVETGKELRRFMHGKQGSGIASLAFSLDGKTLATLGTQAGVLLRLFDVDTGKLRRAFPKDDGVRPDRGSVAFSPDGKTVAAASNSIRLYDTTTGEERLHIDRKASDLHFTDGGKTLTAAVTGTIYRWDTATGKSLIPEGAEGTVSQIHVTADGSRVITCDQYSEADVWDGANGKHLRRFQVGWQSSVALSPDGRFLAWLVGDESVKFTDPQDSTSIYYGSRIRLYDIAADRFVDRFPAFKGGNKDLAFTTDGKKLVTADRHPGMVRIWDFEAAKEERSFPVVTDALKKKSFRVERTQLSADGKTVVVTYVEDTGGLLDFGRGLAGPPHEVRLWNVATGKELPKLDGGTPIAFSPDGRLVLTRGENCVCEIVTGKRVANLPDDPMMYIRSADFSRDGRHLALAVSEERIQIWEVATWTKRTEFKGSQNQSFTLTYGPGGRLFSGHNDTTVLAWDVRPPRVADSVTLESAWNDLATMEAGKSFKSEGKFLAAPADTVKLFAEKIKPVEALDPKRMTSEQLRQIRAVMVLERIGDGESKKLLQKWAGGLVGALLTRESSAALLRLETASKANR